MTSCANNRSHNDEEIILTSVTLSDQNIAPEEEEPVNEENTPIVIQQAIPETTGSISISEAAIPQDSDWQATPAFPDWAGYVDDTLVMNSRYSFEFYHGQGDMYVEVGSGVDSFELSVNGIKADTAQMASGKTYKLSIAGVTVDGTNSIAVTNVFPVSENGSVKVYIPYPIVMNGSPDKSGISKQALTLISDIISEDVENGFPGAQLAIVKGGRLIYSDAWGKVSNYKEDGTKIDSSDITTDTLFDLASVTKAYSTNYAIQKLVNDGQLNLTDKVSDFFGDAFAMDTVDITREGYEYNYLETQRKWKSNLTIEDLMRHRSGFQPDPYYYNGSFDQRTMSFNIYNNTVNSLYVSGLTPEETRQSLVSAICRTPLLYEPKTKTVYSDINYILLGLIVEQVTGTTLDEYVKTTFYQPLGLEHITYKPLDNGFTANDCAATEYAGNTYAGTYDFSGVRTYTLQGEVHDPNAFYCMGGVSGHAGLFSNAEDLAKLASVMLTGGYGNKRFFSTDTIDLFTSPGVNGSEDWGLGWQRHAFNGRNYYFGADSSRDTFGPNGWTGTLVMTDPENDLVIAYLTNKTNSPVEQNGSERTFYGSMYTASTLGFVAQILEAAESGTDAQIEERLTELAADMALESCRLVKSSENVPAEDHPLLLNVRSKLAVLDDMAENTSNEELKELAEHTKKAVEDELNITVD